MNVTMWEHCTFDSKIFRCGEVSYSNSIIITNFVQTNFQSLVGKCLLYLLGIEISLQNFHMQNFIFFKSVLQYLKSFLSVLAIGRVICSFLIRETARLFSIRC
jgi:hypothetical protein